jgi:acetyl esterase/lipase
VSPRPVLRQLLRLEPPRHAPAGHTTAGRTRGPRRPVALTPEAGENEIPTDDAIEFAERAHAVGVYVELRSVPDGQHIFCLGPAGLAWMRCLGRRYAQ